MCIRDRHYGVTVRKEYLTGIERSRFKTFKENKLEFYTFAETSSSETRIVFVRIATNEENDRIQTNIKQQSIWYVQTWKSWFAYCFKVLVKFFFLIHIHTVHEMTPFSHQDAINKSSKIRKSKRTFVHFLASVCLLYTSPSPRDA